jgi:hypothetical protein
MTPHDPDDCQECGRRESVVYRCTSCEYTFDVPGEYRYFAQGRGHWHVADNDARFKHLLAGHVGSHSTAAGFVPLAGDVSAHDGT